MNKIVIDALGADLGPEMVAEGLALAWQEADDFEAVVVGPRARMIGVLQAYEAKIEWVDTSVLISNEEAPALAIRRKKEASMVQAFHRLNEADATALISAGSTGALLAGATFLTRRIKGVRRCCLAALIPTLTGRSSLVVDAGANMDTTPEMLFQFALMGANYACLGLGVADPIVRLLSVGSEAEKGDERVQKTRLLLEQSELTFAGNLEARDLLEGSCDVVVCDGFSGNILIKSYEGCAATLLGQVKETIHTNPWTKLGGLLLQKSLKQRLKKMDYRAHGGAPLLGCRKAVYKAHGNSQPRTFALAIREALNYGSVHLEEAIWRALSASGQEGGSSDAGR